MIAALFVQEGGCYAIPGVDPWGVTRDARLYAGPWPVVAHPPCERWGNYWFGSPSSSERKLLGDDGGCFASALASLRRWGGVLEHPAHSRAWRHFGIFAPPSAGGWVNADFDGLWTCQVDQGHYGHRAPKATWLLAARAKLPALKWGASAGEPKPHDDGRHMSKKRREARGVSYRWTVEGMSKRERAATPPEFRDLLLSIARSVETRDERRAS